MCILNKVRLLMQVVIQLSVLTHSCSVGFTELFVFCRGAAVHNDEPGEKKASREETMLVRQEDEQKEEKKKNLG